MANTTLSSIDDGDAKVGQRARTADPRGEMPQALVSTRGWVWIVVLGALFVMLHLTYLDRLFRIVTNAKGDSFLEVLRNAIGGGSWNPDWSHALVIPLISLYFLYLWRDRLAAAPIRTNPWGLAILCFGVLSYTWWIFPGRNDMLQGYSLVISLFGLVLFLLGEHVMKVAWFPIAYLVFAVKIANRIWEQIAWKMQNIAATVAHVVLQFAGLVFGFEADKSGNTLTISFTDHATGQWVNHAMNVAEACSGLRMLMAFIALGTALAFITPRPWWHRALMVGLAVPVAIVVNVGRVVAIGMLNLVNPEYARGDFHTFVGLLMLIPAGLLILLIGWCANRIFISDQGAADKRSAAAPPPPPPIVKDTDEELSGRERGLAIGKGAVTGVLLALLLGGTYLGMWALSGSALARPLPQQVLLGCMLGLMVLSAIAVAVLGRSVLKALVRPATRVPITAALVGGLLLTMWIGQASAVEYTKVVLIKRTVPCRLPLLMVPQKSGQWEMVSDQSDQMTKEVIEILGTTNFISRLYVDTTAYPPGTTFDETGRGRLEPGTIARLHVAYYTGNPDTVPHVPDRCYLAGGVGYVSKTTVTLHLDETNLIEQPEGGYIGVVKSGLAMDVFLPSLDIPATMFTYIPEHSQNPESVVYFFLANGKFLASPDQVRKLGFDPRDKYAYYCKVEVAIPGVSDQAETQRLIGQVLDQFMPEILACLPDWRAVQAGEWPVPETTPTP